MKTRTKALLIVLCAALLVTVTALTTIAWLTSTPTPVTNTFMFSDNDNVKIILDEAKVDAYGNLEYVEGEGGEKELADRVIANEYKLLPGHSYVKDPTIHVDDNSIDCYLFVTVDNAIADIEAATTIADQMTAKGWVKVDGYTNVYALATTVTQDDGTTKTQLTKKTKGDDVVVFESFTIKGEATATSLAAYDKKTVTVKAYAVQADGFEDMPPETAWATAFPGQGTAETTPAPDPAE